MELTQFVGAIFSGSRDAWKAVTKEDKSAYAFVVNRALAKMYPSTAADLSARGLNPCAVCDYWSLFLRNERRVPGWFWRGGLSAPKNRDRKVLDWVGISAGEASLLRGEPAEDLSHIMLRFKD